MSNDSGFAGEVERRLQGLRQALERRDRDMEESMSRVDVARRRFEDVAGQIGRRVILPRLEALAERFPNAKVDDHHRLFESRYRILFEHTQEYPSTTTVQLTLLPGPNYESIQLLYNLQVLPVLMEYKNQDSVSLALEPLPEREATEWLERNLLEFLDVYLRLPLDPLYQKDNLVIDPICGMPVLKALARAKVEMEHRTVYFCSHACRDAYVREQQNGG